MTYRAPGLAKARVARNSRAYRARRREAARCAECDQEIAELDACTCGRVAPAPRPLRLTRVAKGAS